MSWAKVDDRLYSHPKVLRAGRAAMGLWVVSLSYTCGHDTGGFIPAEMVSMWSAQDSAEELVAVGLWERSGKGYKFHDFYDWNYTEEQRQAIAKVRAESGRKGGLAKAEKFLANSSKNKTGQQTFSDKNCQVVNSLGKSPSKKLAKVWHSESESESESDPISKSKDLESEKRSDPLPPSGNLLAICQNSSAAPETEIWTPRLRSGNETDLKAIWDHYRIFHPRAKVFDTKTQQKANARLKEGFTVAELCTAIDGMHRNPWNLGQDERSNGQQWLDLELAVRDATHVRRFIEDAERFKNGTPRMLTKKEVASAVAKEEFIRRGQ
jgi:hypothetical protein